MISADKKFDARDAEIRAANLAAWNEVEGPRVGDWVWMPDGEMRRFTHHWGDSIQTTLPRSGDACFYFGAGYMSFSGGLDRAIPIARIVATDQIRDGAAWFFHHNHATANNGVYFLVPCRVFNIVAEGESRP